ncbi:MAG: hypothetical protein ACW98Y_05930 [Candidatus Thorarchaeota archaeon]
MVGQRPSRIVKKRVTAIVILSLIIVSSVVVLGTILPTFLMGSHELPPSGTPVLNTTFAGLVSDTADPVFLPAGPIQSNNDCVQMTIVLNYLNQPVITLEEAEQIVLDYFSQFPYMSDVTLEPDPVWNRLADEPYYTLRYFVGQYEFYACVNAITGRVMGISPHWSVLMQYNTTIDSTILSLEEIEERAYDFLEQNNYTLSSNARLEGPKLENNTILSNFPAYHLKFICVINGCMVQSNYLSMFLDIKSGTVIDFFYHWRNVTCIPVEKVVPAIEAEKAALFHLSENLHAFDFNINSSSLQFRVIDSWPILKFQLCWVIDISHDQYGPIIINAIDLEILGVYQYVIE